MLFETERTRAFLLDTRHALAMHRYYIQNASHLAPWIPALPDDYYTPESWAERVVRMREEQQEGRALRVLAFTPDADEIVGICSFTNIVGGVFQACNLGYSISSSREGQGLMTEILDASIDYVFQVLDLHRIMANYMPENERSARVLEKLGFEQEGLARSYLLIAGQWRDHVLTSKLNPGHAANESPVTR